MVNRGFDLENVQSFRFFIKNKKKIKRWIVTEKQLVGFWV